ncbi:MAG TPA: FAD-dependent oxidoreductase [Thermoplasmata archaeon]|nr:FAD-dependent oxidoreductase [Thermoplasmata archaeon]
MAADAGSGPIVVLGAGYAGLGLVQAIDRLARGRAPLVLVDRHPLHVLRTELYEVGRLAREGGDARSFSVPLADVLDRTSVRFRQGELRSIDLAGRTVALDTGTLDFGSLAICVGNVAAYYGVPGAAEHTHQVYRLSGAQRLAAALREVERRSSALPGEARPRVVVIGGGSTGTELASEIATTDWSRIVGASARPPDVFLLTGALPFLAGLPPAVIARAAETLRRVGVTVVRGYNVTRVEPQRISMADGSSLACDLAVWCAGLEAPPVVGALAVPHGRAGRLAVAPTLEVPAWPGIFAIGDVVELRDPVTGALVPSTAQAARAEARVAAKNILARRADRPLVPFRYRERGLIVALGRGRAAGAVQHVTIWGSPAAVLKRIVEREYAGRVGRGEPPRLV